ncbi:hypothetical protein PACTADRAFT_51080 [Pachysolen tannophilus NRRL Y-2460]|uniref:Small ribosomal subunit protein uS4m n=1 Tax=Pachysolen tannophilus NRRL Y-2460 TaxID=669874 RepID=A0A1E4TQZ6_PACTA|nr:hypothetical protein PACTADRAFT_51080 [Pachysolen tannophilus NRRL Y-2460]
MPKKAILLKSLARGRIRASWNKYNLFNLYKKQKVNFNTKTLFQQKWSSKTETRAYHGEQLTEKRFINGNFEPKLKGVAQLDASLKGNGDVEETPIVLQTFAALEKRLDFALFRAMFASSVRQARQFILHKNVKVNGVVIRHPGFPLKSGDIFSIDPEKLLTALGRKKPSLKESYQVDNLQIIKWNTFVNKARENPYEIWIKQQKKKELQKKNLTSQVNQDYLQNDEFSIKKIDQYNNNLMLNMLKIQKMTNRSTILKDIIEISNKNLKDFKNLKIEELKSSIFNEKFGDELSERCLLIINLLKDNPILQKTEIESFDKFLSTNVDEFPENFKHNFKKIKQILSELNSLYLEKLRKDSEALKIDPSSSIDSLPYDPNWTNNLIKHPNLPPLQEIEEKGEDLTKINLPWQSSFFGRADLKKPYFTPWEPRPFLAPFAILPHHIEISFETGHAVYLRDPVARPGQSEVISPFSTDVHKRAYMWYIRR